MQKIVQVCVLSAALVNSLWGAEEVSQDSMVPVQFYQGSLDNRVGEVYLYKKTDLERFTTLDNLIQDTGLKDISDENPLLINLHGTTKADFDYLVYAADPAINLSEKKMVSILVGPENSIEQKKTHRLVGVLKMAAFLAPDSSAYWYPSICLLEHVRALSTTRSRDGLTEQDTFLKEADQNVLYLAVNSMLEQFAGDNYSIDMKMYIEPILETVIETPHLVALCSSTEVRKLLKVIKERAKETFEHARLAQRIDRYLNGLGLSLDRFLIPPKAAGDKVTVGQFPVSLYDLRSAGLLPVVENNILQVIDQHLTSLDVVGPNDTAGIGLHGNALLRLPPEVFAVLTNLQELDLSCNKLTTLKRGGFAGLSHLKILDLNNNKLTELPEGAFDGLPQLNKLLLYSNRLNSISRELFKNLIILKKLNLMNNRLTQLPQEVFRDLNNLEELHLGENQLSSVTPGVFAGLAQLKTLLLALNKIPKCEPAVFEGLGNLEHFTLTVDDVGELKKELFAHMPKLKNLMLRSKKKNQLTKGVLNPLTQLTSFRRFEGEIPMTKKEILEKNPALPKNIEVTDNAHF